MSNSTTFRCPYCGELRSGDSFVEAKEPIAATCPDCLKGAAWTIKHLPQFLENYTKTIPGAKRLWGSQVYLAGPMTSVSDWGEGWRDSLTPRLEELGIIVLDPCHKPTDRGREDGETRRYLAHLRDQGHIEEYRRFFKDIRRVDLRMVDRADFIIIRYDGEHTVGTWEEITVAVQEQKPVLMVLGPNTTFQNLNPWILAMIEMEHIFADDDSLMYYLSNLNASDVHPENKKWCLFHMLPKFIRALGNLLDRNYSTR